MVRITAQHHLAPQVLELHLERQSAVASREAVLKFGESMLATRAEELLPVTSAALVMLVALAVLENWAIPTRSGYVSQHVLNSGAVNGAIRETAPDKQVCPSALVQNAVMVLDAAVVPHAVVQVMMFPFPS